MLTIREEQLSIFARSEVKKFENWMLVHLNRFFPKQCKTAGEPLLRETIQYGIKRAAAYEITLKRDVCKYIDVMVVFGRDFDIDGQLPWAGEILGDRMEPGAKMQALMQAAALRLRKS